MDLAVIEFMVFYFGVSILLTVLFYIFKTTILRNWIFYIPIILTGIIFFPFGLIAFGYSLRMYDERRSERRYYIEEDPMSNDYEAEPFDPSIKW